MDRNHRLNKLIANNPELEVLLKSIAANETTFFAESSKSLNALNDAVLKAGQQLSSPLNKVSKFGQWYYPIVKINNLVPKYEFPKSNIQGLSAIFEYGNRLQQIIEQFTTPEFVRQFQLAEEWANKLKEAKEEAEKNLYHNRIVREHEEESAEKDRIITEYETMINALVEYAKTAHLQQSNISDTGNPQRKIDIEKLKPYFKAAFKGAGNGSPINRFEWLVAHLQVERTAKAFAQIALMIYDSNVLNKEKPATFRGWYSIFCECVGCEMKSYNRCKLMNPPEHLKDLFNYL